MASMWKRLCSERIDLLKPSDGPGRLPATEFVARFSPLKERRLVLIGDSMWPNKLLQACFDGVVTCVPFNPNTVDLFDLCDKVCLFACLNCLPSTVRLSQLFAL
mgnify:CR=1 FL=1